MKIIAVCAGEVNPDDPQRHLSKPWAEENIPLMVQALGDVTCLGLDVLQSGTDYHMQETLTELRKAGLCKPRVWRRATPDLNSRDSRCIGSTDDFRRELWRNLGEWGTIMLITAPCRLLALRAIATGSEWQTRIPKPGEFDVFYWSRRGGFRCEPQTQPCANGE